MDNGPGPWRALAITALACNHDVLLKVEIMPSIMMDDQDRLHVY